MLFALCTYALLQVLTFNSILSALDGVLFVQVETILEQAQLIERLTCLLFVDDKFVDRFVDDHMFWRLFEQNNFHWLLAKV